MQKFKSFVELYTDIIKKVTKTSEKSAKEIVEALSDKEKLILREYENTMIMDEDYYIKKFNLGR